MRVFDTLPREVREALASSAHDWAPGWAHYAIRYALALGFRVPSAVVVERIERADGEEALRREVQLIAGKG